MIMELSYFFLLGMMTLFQGTAANTRYTIRECYGAFMTIRCPGAGEKLKIISINSTFYVGDCPVGLPHPSCVGQLSNDATFFRTLRNRCDTQNRCVNTRVPFLPNPCGYGNRATVVYDCISPVTTTMRPPPVTTEEPRVVIIIEKPGEEETYSMGGKVEVAKESKQSSGTEDSSNLPMILGIVGGVILLLVILAILLCLYLKRSGQNPCDCLNGCFSSCGCCKCNFLSQIKSVGKGWRNSNSSTSNSSTSSSGKPSSYPINTVSKRDIVVMIPGSFENKSYVSEPQKRGLHESEAAFPVMTAPNKYGACPPYADSNSNHKVAAVVTGTSREASTEVTREVLRTGTEKGRRWPLGKKKSPKQTNSAMPMLGTPASMGSEPLSDYYLMPSPSNTPPISMHGVTSLRPFQQLKGGQLLSSAQLRQSIQLQPSINESGSWNGDVRAEGEYDLQWSENEFSEEEDLYEEYTNSNSPRSNKHHGKQSSTGRPTPTGARPALRPKPKMAPKPARSRGSLMLSGIQSRNEDSEA